MQALDFISNVASHHGSMLAAGSIVAVLPVVLTLLGRPYVDPDAYTDDDGVVHDRGQPRTHQALIYGGFVLGLLQAYSGYLTVTTGSQNLATGGALFLNAALLTSRLAKDIKWAFPVAAGGGALVWIRFLQVMEATPSLYVSAGGWLVLSFVLLFPSLYAERGVRFIGEATSYSLPAAALGSVGGLQAVLLAMGLSLTDLPPIILSWILEYLTHFGGF